MDYKNYYEILGVSKGASSAEIKKAYRSLARKLHPDVNPDKDTTSKKFKELSEAYEVIGNEENRKLYDQLGSDWKHYKDRGGEQSSDFNWQQWTQKKGARTPGDFNTGSAESYFGSGDFSNFFEQVFGGGIKKEFHKQQRSNNSNHFGGNPFGQDARASVRKGRDIHAELEITLEEAWRGIEKSVRVNKNQMKIKIPKGIHSGKKLKFKGRGIPDEIGRNPGDLYLKVLIKHHDVFTREGDDLYATVDVGLYQALLGGVVNVPTLNGQIQIRIPAELQSGKVMRIVGHGMPVFQSNEKYGDIYATLQIRIPENLTAKEKKLIKELATLRGEKTDQH